MIIPYSPQNHKESLLHILRLNTPKYFDPSEEADFIAYLDQEATDYFVLLYEGRVAGAGGFNYVDEGKTVRISWDLFHPEVQGKGLGRALVQHRIEQIKKKGGVETVCVRTSQHTFKFYEKVGFTLTSITKDYWAKGYDLYYMEFLS